VRDTFLLAPRNLHFGIEVIRLHDHATLKAIFAVIENRPCRLHASLSDLQLLFHEQHTVVGVHSAKDDFLVGTFKLVPSGVLDALCTIDATPTG
jgi:hypothetical protein